MNKDTNLYDVIDKSHRLIIRYLNTIGCQQEISTTKAIRYLLNLPNHLIDYNFTFIPWYSLSSWVNKHEIKEVNKKEDHGDTFETLTIDKNLENSKYIIHNFELTINKDPKSLNIFRCMNFQAKQIKSTMFIIIDFTMITLNIHPHI
jgi:hypothetical protein